jgi:hypothetical protein
VASGEGAGVVVTRLDELLADVQVGPAPVYDESPEALLIDDDAEILEELLLFFALAGAWSWVAG